MKSILILLASLLVAFGAQAQSVERLHISDLEAGRDGSRFNISMKIDPRSFKLSLNREIEITPILWSADSTEAEVLPSVMIAGKNMYYYNLRNDRPAAPAALYRAGKGSTVSYSQSVEYKPWMETSTLGFMTHELGCCGAPKGDDKTIPAAKIDYRPVIYKPEFIYTHPKASGEKIFNLKGQAYIDFPVNRTEIYPEYRKNPVELAKIVSTIDAVRDNKDASVKRISLKGFASPEGPYMNNVRLARGRTQSLKEYVGKLYDFAPSVYATSFEPEDWEGLRDSLEVSTLPHRNELLALIAENIEPDKKDALMKQRFPADYAYILKNIYPALRHTNYVITYAIKQYTDPAEIKRVMEQRPQELSLEEFYLLAQSYEPGSKDFNHVFDVAVKMFPQDAVANLNAANAAMSAGNMKNAGEYLARSGNGADADYARGVYYALEKNYDEALKYLKSASEKGMRPQAEEAIKTIEAVRNTKTGVTYLND